MAATETRNFDLNTIDGLTVLVVPTDCECGQQFVAGPFLTMKAARAAQSRFPGSVPVALTSVVEELGAAMQGE